MDEEEVARRQQRQLPLIGWALALGTTVFAAIAVGLPYFSPPVADAPPPDTNLLTILAAVHAVVFVNALALSKVLPAKLRARPGGAVSGQIVRWALLEGAALFGIVIVLLAGVQGALPDATIHYAHLASLVWFWFVVWSDTRRLET
jgi:hypothetical protein